ncbi:peptidoglycan DD-metalloendopeptidase family protein [Shigella flexneri]
MVSRRVQALLDQLRAQGIQDEQVLNALAAVPREKFVDEAFEQKAYAHNDTMLVREQQEVKAGQKIATMGSTGTSSTRLHFEIRYKGKSVNPLRYLPQR